MKVKEAKNLEQNIVNSDKIYEMTKTTIDTKDRVNNIPLK